MIKSVFFDIDGTLVSLKTKQCAQSAKEAIQALRAGGVRVYVATGRSKIEMDSENMLADVAFDGYLCNNGQVIYDGAWRCLHATVMNRNDVAAIVDYAERAGLPLWMVGDAGSFISRYDSRVFQVMEAIHTAPPPLGDLREMLDKPIYKAVFFMTAQEARGGTAGGRAPLQTDRVVSAGTGSDSGQRRKAPRHAGGHAPPGNFSGGDDGLWRFRERYRDAKLRGHWRGHGQCDGGDQGSCGLCDYRLRRGRNLECAKALPIDLMPSGVPIPDEKPTSEL